MTDDEDRPVNEDEEVIKEACDKVSRMKQVKVKQHFVSQLFSNYYEAKSFDRKQISALLVGEAKDGQLPGDILQASFAEQVELTQDQVMDVGPAYYRYVVEIIGPLVVEKLFPVSQLDEVFRKGTLQDAEKYHATFREWLKAPENVSSERRQELVSSAPSDWSKFFEGGTPGGNQASNYTSYGPPPPQMQGGGSQDGGMHRVSSNRDMQDNQHQPRKIILLPSVSDYAAPQSNENAWKPKHKRAQTETDEDEKTLGAVRALLNKITPNSYKKLSATMLTLPFTETPELLLGAVDVIFKKALNELNYAKIYAKLCRKLIALETKEPDAKGKPVKFRIVLLHRGQHYFEKMDKELEDAEVEDKKISAAETEKRVKAKRHYLGNIRFISELYRYEMLTDRVILSCFQRLLPKKTDFSDADEEKLECLCKLLQTCSQGIKPEHASQVQMSFDQLKKMIDSKATSSRIRFLMQDTIDLKNNNFVGRKNVVPGKVKPKTLQEVHEEKRQEELAIKNSVKDLPPLPRGEQQGMQGRGGPMNQQHLQGGGTGQKVRSVPGSMSQMQGGPQGGLGGEYGSSGIKQAPSNGMAAKPSKFLSSMGSSNKPGDGFQLGGPSQWSEGNGGLRPSLPTSSRTRREERSELTEVLDTQDQTW